jgi:CRP/FNR family transcriptional regulator, cyclic AMP receptor protein
MAKAIEKKFEQEARAYDDGEIIFREGEETREMYIVQRGEVVVSKKGPRGDIELAVLRKGDFVGEMSLLESLPRTATAKARGKTSLLAIHPGGFLLKIRRDPTFAFEMMQTLSRRIRMTNENLMRELGRDTAQKEAVQTALSRSEFDSTASENAKI